MTAPQRQPDGRPGRADRLPWETDLGVPGGRAFITLLEAFRATGGTVPGDLLARLLEDHQVGQLVSLARRIHSGQVFGFEWRDSLWIPMFQFDASDLAVKDSVQAVRQALPPLWPGWSLAAWFAAPNLHLAGRSPVDTLAADPEAVLQAARALAPHPARALAPAGQVHRLAEHV